METPTATLQEQIEEILQRNKEVFEQTGIRQPSPRITINKHGQEIITYSGGCWQPQPFSSRNEWRERAVAASNLHIRANNLSVTTKDVKTTGICYILPKNLFRKLVIISDTKIQIGGYMFGCSLRSNPQVKEVRCILIPPQWGTNKVVQLATIIPKHKYIEGFQPLGWIHTQCAELEGLFLQDVITTAKIINDNPEWKEVETAHVTCNFTDNPESCSFAGYKITQSGLDWGRQNFNKRNNFEILLESHYERVRLTLTEDFSGFFMIPSDGSWNFNFKPHRHDQDMKYEVNSANPKEFYHEVHRPVHFLNIGRTEGVEFNADFEDTLA